MYKRYTWHLAIKIIVVIVTIAINVESCTECPKTTDENDVHLSDDPITQRAFEHGAKIDHSYTIDGKRFLEVVTSRCGFRTWKWSHKEVRLMEPTFWLIQETDQKGAGLNATANLEQLANAGYRPDKPTIIFIHGFRQSFRSKFLSIIRNLFIANNKLTNYNVFLMNWSPMSNGLYFRVASQTHVIASYLSIFMQRLIDSGADRRYIHLVGNSMGAQLASMAAKRMESPIGKLTALDPAGPCFGGKFLLSKDESHSARHCRECASTANDRVSRNDALNVDVYHYDDRFLGATGCFGHRDIYVNGGTEQPGCDTPTFAHFGAVATFLLRRNRVISQSHMRAVVVVGQKLDWNTCQQVAYTCSSYKAFANGECGTCDEDNSQCHLISHDWQFADPIEYFQRQLSSEGTSSQKLYIRTGDGGNFCSQHYQIVVHFGLANDSLLANKRHDMISDRRSRYDELNIDSSTHPSIVKIPREVQLHFNIDDERQLSVNVEHAPAQSSYKLTHLLLLDGAPARLASTLATWKSSTGSKSGTRLHVNMIEINYMSSIDPIKRRAMSSRLCYDKPFAVTNGDLEQIDQLRADHLSEC